MDEFIENIKEQILELIKNKSSTIIVLKNSRKIITNPRFIFDIKALEQGYLRWTYNNRSDEVSLMNISSIELQKRIY